MINKQEIKKSATGLKYLLYLPKGYSPHDPGKFPIIYFLHGAGERGDDPELLKKHGIPKVIEERVDFPFIAVSPQCPISEYWSVGQLKDLIDETLKNLQPDKNKIYLTGISMGGYGTWSLAGHYPDLFAAIIPVCGGGDPSHAYRIKEVPVWAFHGAKDYIVPLWESENMVNELKKAEGDVQLTIYPEAGHDSWTQTYDNTEIYEWLLSHKKTHNRTMHK
ncbi:MAG: prolyl oligopeptidase family serine peptidase [Cytophagaceae bacterium]